MPCRCRARRSTSAPSAPNGSATDGTRTPLWLHTSPEFAMKTLLVAGAGPIVQLARVWRNEEGSDTHAAEFSMLEWYRPGASLAGLMDETEALLRAVLPPVVRCRGVETSLAGFERVTVAEAFARWAGADVLGTAGDAPALAAQAGTRLRDGETWEDLFFRLLLERVEPQLGRHAPTFLTHWPAAQAALARRDPADDRVALRFELFVCGMELANAFEELTDAAEQRARFAADRTRREAVYGREWGGRRKLPRCPGAWDAGGQRDRARLRPAGHDRRGRRPDRSGRLDGSGVLTRPVSRPSSRKPADPGSPASACGSRGSSRG